MYIACDLAYTEFMHAYRNIKLTAGPDVADIHKEGRRSAVGRIPRGETDYKGKIVHNDRGYCRPVGKAVIRRALKKVDRRITDLELFEAIED